MVRGPEGVVAMAVVFAAGFAVLFVVAVVAGSVWTLFLWGVTSIGIGCN